MENHVNQNQSTNKVENPIGMKNHVFSSYKTGGISLKNRDKEKNGDVNHQDNLLNSNLKRSNLTDYKDEDNLIEQLIENRNVPNKLDLVDTYQNSMNIDSPDTEDLFNSCKKDTKISNESKHNRATTLKTNSIPIKSNVNSELNAYESLLGPLDEKVTNVTKRIESLSAEKTDEVTNATKKNSDSNSNISMIPNVIQLSTTNDLLQKQTILTEANSDNAETNLDNSEHSSSKTNDLNPFPNSNLSHIVDKVNSLNLDVSPKVVFHTPHTTPLKLKLNSLPVQSHPLDDHALNGMDDSESFRNEPLDFPNSPVLNKCIDEICLKRYKRSEAASKRADDRDTLEKGVKELNCTRKQQIPKVNCAKEVNCMETQQLNTVKTPQSNCTSPQQMNALKVVSQPSTSASLESVSLARTSPGAEFTNNVSAESYLKKYDDINAQVRAYLNKTNSNNQSDLEELNERTHRYLHANRDAISPSGDLHDAINASNKVTYVSDDEDTSLYDTVVTQDCNGVKLIKHSRKSIPATAPTTETKKKLLTADLFSGNLLDDDLQSLSDEDIDDLLSPVDDDLENSILEQLNLSDDDVESIQELSAKEEREESRRWKVAMVNGVEKRIDMKVIEPYKRVLSHGGYLSEGCHNAIIVFSACFLPHHGRADYHYVMDNLFFYVLHTLDQLITEDYVLVYLHGATSRHNMPTFAWLKRCYQMIDRKLKKNLKQLYLVHATFWLKTIVVMSKPFISSKFSKKIRFVLSLNELQERLPIEEASIPDKVKQYDKIKLSMSRTE